MPVQQSSWVYGEDTAPALILKQDTAADHQVKKAVLGDQCVGIAHNGTREAPIPGVTSLVAKTGESAQVFGEGDTCEVEVGTIAITAGDRIAPDANSKAQPAVHGFPYVGYAEAAAAASAKARVKVELGIHDNSRTVITKTDAESPYTVALKDLGATLETTGAAAAVEFDLPAAVVGYEIRASVGAAQELRLDPNGTETIALPSTGVQGAAGKYLTANAENETVHLKCNRTGEWDAISYTGTWTAEA